MYQPVAVDLRHIIAILKINDDLERIADFGSNIAQRVLDLTIEKPLELMPNLPKMFAKVEIMLEKSVDSIFEKDKAMVVTMPIYIPREVDKITFSAIFLKICRNFYKTRNKNKTKNILHRILIVLI